MLYFQWCHKTPLTILSWAFLMLLNKALRLYLSWIIWKKRFRLTHLNTLYVFALQLLQTLGGDERTQFCPLNISQQLWVPHHVWAAKTRASHSDRLCLRSRSSAFYFKYLL